MIERQRTDRPSPGRLRVPGGGDGACGKAARPLLVRGLTDEATASSSGERRRGDRFGRDIPRRFVEVVIPLD